jgi:hypothetical protein
VPAAISAHAISDRKPSNAFLFAVMAVPLAFFLILSLPEECRNMRWHRDHRKEIAAGPPSHIPKIDSTPADAMLILAPIGEYLPEPARAEHSPIEQVYSVRYSLSGGSSDGPSSVGPHVDVTVQDWLSGWAKTELESQGQGFSKTPNPNAYSIGAEARTEFGNRILFKPDRDAHYGHYAWISNDRLVMIDFNSVAPDEFLKKYLEKYPSSL